tara:strand:- start:47 stop:994 length:948 start_codon:yes stop_codon:yes gene_type:complete
MNIKDLIKKELEEQTMKTMKMKDRDLDPPDGDEEDTDISSPEFEKFGKLSKKDAKKGWGDGPVREAIRQEILRTLEEHGELDEGFLDRLKANIAGAVGSAGAKVSQARSKVGAAVAGPGSDVAYTGPNPAMKANGIKLRSRAKSLQKKFTKLVADFDNDAARLGLNVDTLTPVAASADALQSALKTVIYTANQMSQGKEVSPSDTLRVNMRTAGDSEIGKRIAKLAAQQAAQIKDTATEKQVSGPMQGYGAGAPIQPRQTAKQTSGPGPESTKDKIKRAARKSGDALSRSTRQKGQQMSEQLIQKIVDMLVENFK